jgi:hypothetical protein
LPASGLLELDARDITLREVFDTLLPALVDSSFALPDRQGLGLAPDCAKLKEVAVVISST